MAALRDLGWTVEMEAYEEYMLPDAVLAPSISGRVISTTISLDGDLLLPRLMVQPGGRMVPLDAAGRRILR